MAPKSYIRSSSKTVTKKFQNNNPALIVPYFIKSFYELILKIKTYETKIDLIGGKRLKLSKIDDIDVLESGRKNLELPTEIAVTETLFNK